MIRKFLLVLFTIAITFGTKAQEKVEYNSFWSNWYAQAGLDMSLQKPYGHRFSKVFPNGKTFGVDAALGKWFTPELGIRAKLNWENGIGLFRNNHANWLAPFNKPGVNMDKGGYITTVADVQLDIHNLIWGYRKDRMWNFLAFVRAGFDYNFGVSKGSPLLGLGIGITFKINPRWSIFCDAAFQGVSSGHTGEEGNTGLGAGFNGFFDFNIGMQFNIGDTGWKIVQ